MDPVLPAGPSPRSASEASAEERAQKLKRQAEESPWYILWEGVWNGGMGMGEYRNGCMDRVLDTEAVEYIIMSSGIRMGE